MKTSSLLLKALLLGTVMVAGSPFQAPAQLEVCLSIKVILDTNGMRTAGGTLSTDEGIRSTVSAANDILASFHRGYQFRITEILDLPGHAELLDLACQDASDAIEAGVQINPASYAWRTNAANVYINRAADDTGSCAFNGLLVLKYTGGAGTLLHEGGHHLGLCHTQGCGCKDCTDCPGIVDDGIDDTLPDRWFDEPNRHGAYKGEHIDRAEFDAMLSRFYSISNLTDEGIPVESWRRELETALDAH